MKMSYTYVKLLIYILAGFIGISNIGFLLFLTKYKNSSNVRLYRATRNFTFSALLLVGMYLIFLFIRFIFGSLDNSAILRVCDIIAFLGLKYFWLKIILEIIAVNEARLHRLIDGIFLVFTVLCVINFGFLMDSQYFIADITIRSYVVVVSLLLIVIPLIVNLYLIIKYNHQMMTKPDKIFIVTTSMLIHLNAVWNSMMAVGLYSGKILLSTWKTPITDPTSVFLLLINLNIFIFIFKKDFSPLFKPSAEIQTSKKKELSDQTIIDILSVKHSLTEREREVTILIYQGCTNPDIADKLYISKNTVRNHIHNIFYKLDISSRMELIHLVNSQR